MAQVVEKRTSSDELIDVRFRSLALTMLRAFTSPPTISRLFTRPQALAGLGAYGRHIRGYASKILSSCPSCGTSLPTTLPACPKCRWIDTLDGTVRRHDVFEVPYAYSVDQTAVKQAFRKLQRVVHPDLWADSDHVSASVSLHPSSYAD
jgi:molecular chaperone HscB